MLHRLAARVALIVLLALATSTARAAEPGESLTVSVLTIGPGDEAFSKFGHVAILIEDANQDPDWVYNYGTFSFRSPTLISDFLRGRLRYWLSVERFERMLQGYARARRTVRRQELELAPAERRKIAEFLAWNALPEHRAYLYDYYRDNCSTRVRDVLDRALGGALRRVSEQPAELTYRDHTRRLTAEDLPLYLGLDVLTGPLVDAPIRRWDEAFLPDRLAAILRDVTVSTPTGQKPLVRRETVLVTADRPPLRGEPPAWWPYFALLGTVLGLAFVPLGYFAGRSRWAELALGGTLAVLGTAAGLLGTIFLYFWFATNHEFGHKNANLLLCSPHLLALSALGAAVALGGPRGTRALRAAKYVLGLAAALGLAAILGVWRQHNYEFAALLLPIWLGLDSAVALASRRRKTP
jgi:hypothetical protein